MGFSEYSSSQKVNAEQVEESRSVITPQGPITAYPGQWEVRYPDGNVRILDDDAFQQEWGEGDADPSQPESSGSGVSGIGQTVAPATVEMGSGTSGSDTSVTTDDAASESESSQVSDADSTGSSPAPETTVPATDSSPTATAATPEQSG